MILFSLRWWIKLQRYSVEKYTWIDEKWDHSTTKKKDGELSIQIRMYELTIIEQKIEDERNLRQIQDRNEIDWIQLNSLINQW